MWQKPSKISRPITFEPIVAMAQSLAGPLCVRKFVGSFALRVIPKTLKWFQLLFRLLSIKIAELVGPMSVYCDWGEYHVMCPGIYLMRQHSKSEH